MLSQAAVEICKSVRNEIVTVRLWSTTVLWSVDESPIGTIARAEVESTTNLAGERDGVGARPPTKTLRGEESAKGRVADHTNPIEISRLK
jgi:hypothetical protein